MVATKRPGYRLGAFGRDEKGHRTFKINFVVETSDPAGDGPLTVLAATGLPTVGSTWAIPNESDSWAFCLPTVRVTPRIGDEPCNVWDAEFNYSTRPLNRCNDTEISDPLSEPDRIGGSFTKYTKEVFKDRFGNAIVTSSHEMIRGPQVEFDANKPTVWVEQNEISLGLATFAAMIDTVNDSTLWGVPARCVKLSNVSWERKLYGVCTYYYTRRLEFEIDYNGFDRQVPDEGTKVLAGDWDDNGNWVVRTIDGAPANPDNPAHFIRYKDLNGENARVFLNGAGLPADSYILNSGTGSSGEAGIIDIEYYPESNFLTLGIPTTF